MNRLFLLLFGASTLVAHAQIPDYVPTDGLVGWYPFDGNANDESESGNHGDVYGAIPGTNRHGDVGASLDFDGNTDYAEIAHSDAWNGLQELSISIWFHLDTFSNHYAFCGGGTGSYNAILHKWSNTNDSRTFEIRIQDWDVGQNPAENFYLNACRGHDGWYGCQQADWSNDMILSHWHHLLVVYGTQSTDVHIDGNLIHSEGLSDTYNTINISSNPIRIGNFLWSCTMDGFDGRLDDLGFWNRALTEEEITALYNAELPILGCTDSTACNFNEEADEDDNSCVYPPSESVDCEFGGNYCGEGTVWDSSLQTCVGFDDCPADLNGNGLVEISDLLMVLADFGTECSPEVAEWTCGDPVSYQGYDYATVLIGEQCWFAENLRNENYDNGDVIPAGLSDSEWTSTNSGATAVYGEDAGCSNFAPDIDACDPEQSLNEYGRLYNWYAVDDSRGLCPSGWHVPTDEEWTDLEDYITAQGFSGTAGMALKSTYGWSNGGNGTDDFGFAALPGGNRARLNGNFNDAGRLGDWWSSSLNGGEAWFRNLYSPSQGILRSDFFLRHGMAVRCLSDAE